MNLKVVSGGQTGIDRMALEVAVITPIFALPGLSTAFHCLEIVPVIGDFQF